jgi:aryl-alcohol dehydrogenase-like predicted oxidoreductase
MKSLEDRMISRREWLTITAGAGATLALSPTLFGATQQSPGRGGLNAGQLIERAIPSTGEKLPVIGLGRGWAKSLDESSLKQTIKTLIDHGGSVIDSVHGGPDVRQLVGKIVSELGVQDKVFWSTGVMADPPRGGTANLPQKVDPAAVKAEMEKLFAMFKADTIDLVQVYGHADIATHLAVLREMKKEGRIRHIGVTELILDPMGNSPAAASLASIMRKEELDFVSFDYSIGDRQAEKVLLPLAQERKMGVMAYFTLDRGRILKRVGNPPNPPKPLPEWAAEFDAKTWPQFFLKYVVSHPAVTVARTGTSNPKHMLDNLGGGIGRLPDEAMRKRMAELVDSWPVPQVGRAGG